jgi:hypothetical protein
MKPRVGVGVIRGQWPVDEHAPERPAPEVVTVLGRTADQRRGEGVHGVQLPIVAPHTQSRRGGVAGLAQPPVEPVDVGVIGMT